jgi:hypothetical protein
MATGTLPFPGTSTTAIFDAILNKEPVPATQKNPAIPPQMAKIIERALAKKRDHRYQSAQEIVDDLKELRQPASDPAPVPSFIRKPKFLVPVIAVLLVLVLAGVLLARRSARATWVRENATPEIQRLALERKGIAAYKLLKQAERYAPNDTALQKVKAENFAPREIHTLPAGAQVYVRDYDDVKAEWMYLGQSPIQERLPVWSYYAFQIRKDGYETAYATWNVGSERLQNIVLDKADTLPPGMVRVPAGDIDPTGREVIKLPDFLIDKFEVTNAEFKKFVDAGGYQDAKYWKYSFVKDGKTLEFRDAMLLLGDKTGRTWSRHMGSRPLCTERRRLSGKSCELVRSRSLRRICGQEPPYRLSLVSRRRHGDVFGGSAGQQFCRQRSSQSRQLSRPRTVRHL